ncbi:hypothetical protein I3842_Q008100 [Carya illinoinensis]|uniref:Cytochrome c assembly protein domain-containing protein n=1 Tax=Carya illinoinensis TaxID=32201 RepID=A0A922A543_CARIL|nr:hypothetical protein I3842_Q008100 [Carya illinoinensis]
MSVSLLQPYFFMSKTRSYAQIIIGSRLFLTAMAIHLSLRVAPLDLQQGGNSRIPYVHVPAARMSILVYIATAINTFFFLLTKHPLFLRSSGISTEMGAFFTLFTLVTGGFRGRPMWGTFWVWDARLTSVLISFLIYLGALRFQKLPVEPASISIRAGPIDIPIIKSSVNWWNTSHQPGSISRSGTSIHVPMLIPILSNFANFPFSTRIFFVLETRLPIPSFLESPLTEEIEAREGIRTPSSLAEQSAGSRVFHLRRSPHRAKQCPKREKLNALIAEEEEAPVEETTSRVNPLQLLNSIRQESRSDTGLMFVDVKVNGQVVRAMVDTGATHNFLSDWIVARLGLRVDKGNSKMKAVNSEAKPIVRVAKIVPLQIGEWSGKFYLMVVPLDDFHFILSLEFLRKIRVYVSPL